MLDVLKKHLEPTKVQCAVGVWSLTLDEEEKTVFKSLEEAGDSINAASLFKDLCQTEKLPFKLTIFRAHLKGYCACQKN